MSRRLLENPLAHIAFIALLGLLAYSNTFHVPFQWDSSYITKNPAVKDISYFLHPSKTNDFEHSDAIKKRYVGYLSFALNYRLHGMEVTGYHVVNLIIHIANALLVWFLVRLTFRTPFIDSTALAGQTGHIALFTGLVFVSHPVQTEAVTYIFQRLASLAALFYLCSLVFYIKWRLRAIEIASGLFVPRNDSHCERSEAISGGSSLRFYFLSLFFAVLAMKTKENAFTLPLVIALYELMFFRSTPSSNPPPPPCSKGGSIVLAAEVAEDGTQNSNPPFRKGGTGGLYLLPFLLVMLIIPFTAGGINHIIGGMAPDYLLTELRVMVTYIRLIFLPINQNLDYDYPRYSSFFDPEVFLSFVFFISVIGASVYLYYRTKRSPASRLIAFGVFWFFVTLSVESSIIPLPMVIDEYRLYLPSVGPFLAASTGIFLLIGKLRDKHARNTAVWTALLIPLALTVGSYNRNRVWANEISLWQDVVEKSPKKARGHYNLGLAYDSGGLTDKAIEQFEIAAGLAPEDAKIHNNLGLAYKAKGMTDKAVAHLKKASELASEMAEPHFNLGLLYLEAGLDSEAKVELSAAIRIDPNHAEAKRFLRYLNGTRQR